MTNRSLLLAIILVVAAQPAFAAVNVSGGVDPTTGLTTLGSWILSLVGVVIPLIVPSKARTQWPKVVISDPMSGAP